MLEEHQKSLCFLWSSRSVPTTAGSCTSRKHTQHTDRPGLSWGVSEGIRWHSFKMFAFKTEAHSEDHAGPESQVFVWLFPVSASLVLSLYPCAIKPGPGPIGNYLWIMWLIKPALSLIAFWRKRKKNETKLLRTRMVAPCSNRCLESPVLTEHLRNLSVYKELLY